VEGEISPSRTMARALNRLRRALADEAAATVTSLATSRTALCIPAWGMEVTCRTHPDQGHAVWWFWLDGAAIARADELPAAVEALKRAHAERVKA
jgi:hypothetical protein